MNSKIKQYIVIGLISVGISSVITGYLVHQDFKYERNRELTLQKSMEENRSKLVIHVRKIYAGIMDPNDLAQLVNHIETNYRCD